MKLLIELDEEYVKVIDKIKFLVGGRTDRKLQLEIIKAIKNGKPLAQEPRWIPVSERLPESDEEYHTFLVTDSKGRVTLSEFYLSISDRKPYWSGMIDVLAWMPLPKPYREVEE